MSCINDWLHNFLYEEDSVEYRKKKKMPVLIKLCIVFMFFFLCIVGYAMITPQEDMETTYAEGKVIPGSHAVMLRSEYDGEIRHILVKEGRYVRENDVLLEIDCNNEYGRKILHKIKAPFSGTVYNIAIKKGNNKIKKQDSLIEVIPENTTLYAEVWIDNDFYDVFKVGTPVKAKIDALLFDKDEYFPCTVVEVGKKRVFNNKTNREERYMLVSFDNKEITINGETLKGSPNMRVIVEKDVFAKNWAYSVLEPFYMLKNFVVGS